MPDLVRRDWPDHSQLATRDETQHTLTAPASSEPTDPAELLERIRLRQKDIGQLDLDDEGIRELRDAGRP